MRIQPIKLIKSIAQTFADNDDPMERPSTPLSFLRVSRPATRVTIDGNRLLLKGREIRELVDESLIGDRSRLSTIAGELEGFKKSQLERARRAQKRGRLPPGLMDDISRQVALAEAHLARIGGFLHDRYEETQSGVKFFLDEGGQLIMNGMNVHMFVEACKEYPTPKSRAFLKGIRARLAVILSSRSGGHCERIREVVIALFSDIDGVLSVPVGGSA